MGAGNAFGVLGGDRRQIYFARSVAADGYPVFLSGFENSDELGDLPTLERQELFLRCNTIVLPLPATKDGATLNAPFAEQPIVLDDNFAASCVGKTVYGGMTDRLVQTSELWRRVPVYDYYAREELTVGNAFLTAEGALGLAISEYDGAVGGSRCLVTGFGRIGKALCLALKGLGAHVDCCARKPQDLAAIRALGCGALEYREVKTGYDLIFNTVPAPVINARLLALQRPDTLLIELASRPGGIDLPAAKRLNLRVIDAQSLPGRMSPRASGELIKEAIYNMMEES